MKWRIFTTSCTTRINRRFSEMEQIQVRYFWDRLLQNHNYIFDYEFFQFLKNSSRKIYKRVSFVAKILPPDLLVDSPTNRDAKDRELIRRRTERKLKNKYFEV